MIHITDQGLDLTCDACGVSITNFGYALAKTTNELYSNATEAGYLLVKTLVKCGYCVEN